MLRDKSNLLREITYHLTTNAASESYTPQHWRWLNLQTISYDTSKKATIA